MADVWALVDGTARFPARPIRLATEDHPVHVGYYEGDVPICGRCGCAAEPTSVTPAGIARGWQHRAALRSEDVA